MDGDLYFQVILKLNIFIASLLTKYASKNRIANFLLDSKIIHVFVVVASL